MTITDQQTINNIATHRAAWGLCSGVRNERIGVRALRIIRIREHRICGRSASVSVLPLRVRELTASATVL